MSEKLPLIAADVDSGLLTCNGTIPANQPTRVSLAEVTAFMPHVADHTARLAFENFTSVVGTRRLCAPLTKNQLKSLLLIGARCWSNVMGVMVRVTRGPRLDCVTGQCAARNVGNCLPVDTVSHP